LAADPDQADQRTFWNGPVGMSWVANAADQDALLAPVGDLLLAEAALAPGERVLDIGCGAGASSLAAAQAVGPQGLVTGIDISAPLLACAEAARRRAGFDNLDLIEGDAASHPLPRHGFDAVISRFGVMFFADPVAAFTAIARTLRPGGRIVFVAWAGLDANPWFALPRAVAETRLGPGSPGNPDAPGPMAFRNLDRVRGILTAAGFEAVEGATRRLELSHPGGVAAVSALATRLGPASARLRETAPPPETVSALTADLARAFAAFETPQGLRLPAAVNLLRGRSPTA
jgi:SAM-dependent methyltransferase